MPWFKDIGLRWALLVGFWFRVFPLARWQDTDCVRDACAYLGLAKLMAAGQGMTLNTSDSPWLWAPGYPAFLAAHQKLFGFAEVAVLTQCLLAGASQVLAFLLMREHLDRRAGLAAAWLLGLSPTLAFFAGAFWSETLYIFLLLLGLWSLDRARQGPAWRGLLVGGLVGLVMLVKGAALYVLPIFLLGLLWGRFRERKAWLSAGALLLGAGLAVAPYSLHATQKFGGFVLTERTQGHNLWTAYNDFEPNAFDWGVGVLDKGATRALREEGRPHCDTSLSIVEWDRCETRNALDWIREHPDLVLQRIPRRLTQLFNPNSFLTRHVRTGRWLGLNPALGEGLLLSTIAASALAVFGGLLGSLGRGRGWLLFTLSALVLYHCALGGALTGLTRFRVPADALGLLYAGALLAAPRQTLAGLEGWRRWLAVGLALLLLPLMGWLAVPGYLP